MYVVVFFLGACHLFDEKPARSLHILVFVLVPAAISVSVPCRCRVAAAAVLVFPMFFPMSWNVPRRSRFVSVFLPLCHVPVPRSRREDPTAKISVDRQVLRAQ